MNVRFLESARAEIRDIFDYYEQQRPGLGGEFARALAGAVDDILQAPQAWPRLSPNIRRRRTGAFPYGVFYSLEGDDVLIHAVIHLHRDPKSWEHWLR